MDFDLPKAIEILQRTPQVLDGLLSGVSDEWIYTNEGDQSWSTFDVVGHLIHGEKTDWIIRMEIILSDSPQKDFPPFDRFAQFEQSRDKTIRELLDQFKAVRDRNLATLHSKNLTDDQLTRTGFHPTFGAVTLKQLLATWVAHDLGHLAQISRVMAKQYKFEVGPWREYLPIMDR